MGTDIHTIAQIKSNYSGKWETKADNIANEWRSYDTFAVLANVRNGYGFAGCDTGEGWEPIDEPRGLPNGIETSHKWNWDAREKWLGDHNHSWVTLAELKSAIKKYESKPYKINGVLRRENFLKWQATGGTPNSWCGGVSGWSIRQVSDKEFIKLKKTGLGADVTHIETSWEVPALSRLTYLRNCIRHLELIKDTSYDDDLSDDDIRMVFGFDS